MLPSASPREGAAQTEADGNAVADEPDPPDTPACDPAKRNRALFFTVFPSIMIPMFLAMVDQTIVSTALPAIAAELGDVEAGVVDRRLLPSSHDDRRARVWPPR